MTLVVVTVGVAVIWLVKQALAALIGQQVRGSIPEYTARTARTAAEDLPAGLREACEAEWLAELATLDAKPITAIRYARGLRRAAREIAGEERGHSPPSRVNLVASRGRDFASSVVLLFFVAPWLLTIALSALLLVGDRPVISRISEPGRNGRPFDRLRFNTIRRRADGRYVHTRLGSFLARTSLDQLPGLLNVLRGDLALIGPPSPFQVPDDEELLSPKVRPGLISWQSLAASGVVKMLKEDAKYRDEHRTFRNDIALFLHCIQVAIRAERHADGN